MSGKRNVSDCRGHELANALYIGKVQPLTWCCVFYRDAPKSPRLRLWPVRCGDSSRVLIGTAGGSRSDWRSDWPERVQAFSARVRAAIDSTRAEASGSL